MEVHPEKGVLKEREVSKQQETLSLANLCTPCNLRGQYNWEEK